MTTTRTCLVCRRVIARRTRRCPHCGMDDPSFHLSAVVVLSLAGERRFRDVLRFPWLPGGLVCLMVWTATHPRLELGERDPGSTELYYDAVTFVTSDNVRLDGALFPVLDARQVIEEQERAPPRGSPTFTKTEASPAKPVHFLRLVWHFRIACVSVA